MGHKVKPSSLRLQINQDWLSRWFDIRRTALFLKTDHEIRTLISEMFPKLGITGVEIERRSGDRCDVTIKTARPGVIIGREGRILRTLKERLYERVRALYAKERVDPPTVNLNIEELKRPYTSASALAQMAAVEIEKRSPVRTVMKRLIQRARQHKEVLGVKVRVSGRLNGAEIHRTEILSEGRMPLSRLRSDFDYAEETAQCTYGTIGIKVWLYKGEKEEYFE